MSALFDHTASCTASLPPRARRPANRASSPWRALVFAFALIAGATTLAQEAVPPDAAATAGAAVPAETAGVPESAAAVPPLAGPNPERQGPRVVVEDHTVLESLALAVHVLPLWITLATLCGALFAIAGMARGFRKPPLVRSPAAEATPQTTSRTSAAVRARRPPPVPPGRAFAGSAAPPPRPSAPEPGLREPVPAGIAKSSGASRCASAAKDPALAARLRERYLQVRFLGALNREADLADAALVAHAARQFLNDGLVDRAYELAVLAAASHPGDPRLQLVNLEVSFVAGNADRFLRVAGALAPVADATVRQVIRGLGRQLVPGDTRFGQPAAGAVESVAFSDPAQCAANTASRPIADEAASHLALDKELLARLMALPTAFSRPAIKAA